MGTAPYRPAREIAITARRIACDDPASYTNPVAPSTAATPTPATDILDSHPGQPRWWPTFTNAAAAATAAGILLYMAGQQLLGAAIAATTAVTWSVTRIAVFHVHRQP